MCWVPVQEVQETIGEILAECCENDEGTEHLFHEKKMRELGFLSLEKNDWERILRIQIPSVQMSRGQTTLFSGAQTQGKGQRAQTETEEILLNVRTVISSVMVVGR